MNKLYDFGTWIEWNEHWILDSGLTQSEIHDMYLADLATDMAKPEIKLEVNHAH